MPNSNTFQQEWHAGVGFKCLHHFCFGYHVQNYESNKQSVHIAARRRWIADANATNVHILPIPVKSLTLSLIMTIGSQSNPQRIIHTRSFISLKMNRFCFCIEWQEYTTF